MIGWAGLEMELLRIDTHVDGGVCVLTCCVYVAAGSELKTCPYNGKRPRLRWWFRLRSDPVSVLLVGAARCPHDDK